MFVSVVLERKRTGSIIREYHAIELGYGGPNRGIVEVAKNVARRHTCDWIISCMQLTEYEFRAVAHELASERRMVEKMMGFSFEELVK